MAKDIIIDQAERDLALADRQDWGLPAFEAFWGEALPGDAESDLPICNIAVPASLAPSLFREDGTALCRFRAPYRPIASPFYARILVSRGEGELVPLSPCFDGFGLQACCRLPWQQAAAPLDASMLRFVDMDGDHLLRAVPAGGSWKAYVYSAKRTDLEIGRSDAQEGALLSACVPGCYHRYPAAGVGLCAYLNSVPENTGLMETLEAQFTQDGKPLREASFDSLTGALDVAYPPTEGDAAPAATGEAGFFERFTDEEVRRNIAVVESDGSDFASLLAGHESFAGIYFFPGAGSELERPADLVEEGVIGLDGRVEAREGYFVVTFEASPGDVVMFDDEEGAPEGLPAFIVGGLSQDGVYKDLIDQPHWISRKCHKCFIVARRAQVRYVVSKSQFLAGKGLFRVAQTAANAKNLLAVAQDSATGRLVAIVSPKTNIDDVVLDEVTSRLYAVKNGG